MISPNIYHIEETDSTNSLLRQLSATEALPHGYTVWADHQTDGRGQQGNQWESAAGQNICMSLLLHPSHILPENQFIISQTVSVAIVVILNNYAPGFTIKWPNDIYWNEKKIGGVLIENDLMANSIRQSIIGIGLNVNQITFRSDAPNPISLYNIIGGPTNREELTTNIIHSILSTFNLTLNTATAVQAHYFSLLIRADHKDYPFRDENGTFYGKITKVAPDGTLTICKKNGTHHHYHFKEVEYIFDNNEINTL